MVGGLGIQGPKALQQSSKQTALFTAARLNSLGRLDRGVRQVFFHILDMEILGHITKVAGPQHMVYNFSGRDGVSIEDIIDAQKDQRTKQLAGGGLLISHKDDPYLRKILPD